MCSWRWMLPSAGVVAYEYISVRVRANTCALHRDDLQHIFPPERLGALVEKNSKLAVTAMCVLCDHESFPSYLKQAKPLSFPFNPTICAIHLTVRSFSSSRCPSPPLKPRAR